MISVTVLTKNCASTLASTLDSLKNFQEIVIYDTGSSDETLLIAKRYPNVVIYQKEFLGFGPTHNNASSLASFDWILSIDSDEVLSSDLIAEILRLKLDPRCVYSLSRQNFYNGKHIKWCGGWHPDPVVRLYNRTKTRFTDDAVHEKIISKGFSCFPLSSPLFHTPYREIEDFLSKMQVYSSLFAKEHKNKKKSSLAKALLHSFHAFFKSYILKKGFLGGKEGFIISAYNSHTAFYKYLKLWEAAKK